MTQQAVDEQLVLSVAEIEALCRVLDGGLPDHILRMIKPGSDGPTRFETAVHSLLARGLLLRQDDGGWAVPGPVSDMVQLIYRPGLVCHIDSEVAGELSLFTVYATPDQALFEDIAEDDVFAYSMVASDALLALLIELTDLNRVESRAEERVLLVATAQALSDAGTALLNDDVAGAIRCLTSVGADPGAAAEFVDAVVTDRRASHGISTVSRVDDVLAANVTAWVDCGSKGLWLIDPDDRLLDESVAELQNPSTSGSIVSVSTVVERVSAAEVIGRIVASLPGA